LSVFLLFDIETFDGHINTIIGRIRDDYNQLNDGHQFPVDLNQFKTLKLDPKNAKLTAEQKQDLLHNINIFRDAIIAFTATGAARGVSGHTGGPFDTAPEMCILLAFINANPEGFVTPCLTRPAIELPHNICWLPWTARSTLTTC